MRWTPNRVLALYLSLGLFFLGLLGLFAAPTLQEGTWTFYKLDIVMNLIHVGTGAIGLLARVSLIRPAGFSTSCSG